MKSLNIALGSFVILNAFAAAPAAAAFDTRTIFVSATIAQSATISTDQLSAATSYTATNRAALPFSVSSNDLPGYDFTVTGNNASNSPFMLAGLAGNGDSPTYAYYGSRPTNADGDAMSAVYAADNGQGAGATFAVNQTVLAQDLPVPSAQTLVVTVNLR